MVSTDLQQSNILDLLGSGIPWEVLFLSFLPRAGNLLSKLTYSIDLSARASFRRRWGCRKYRTQPDLNLPNIILIEYPILPIKPHIIVHTQQHKLITSMVFENMINTISPTEWSSTYQFLLPKTVWTIVIVFDLTPYEWHYTK